MSDADISNLLRDWPYEPGQINAREFEGRDGRRKIQMRIELGIIHMEAEGRPDGRQPHHCESLLEHYRVRLDEYIQRNDTPDGFTLTSQECSQLREEAVQYYHRYVALYALGELDGVIRDTQRNLAVFDLCRAHGESESDRTLLEQFRPQVIMMRTRCEAELAIRARQAQQAKLVIDRGLEEIRSAYAMMNAAEDFEQANEVQLLRGMRNALVPKLPSSQRQELLERLQAAIDAENYELAAILRDELKML